MPALPLYHPVVWPCSCCGLEREFTFTSQSDQTVCVYCKRHAQDANKRNELHRDWWMQYKEQLISH